MIPDDVLRAMRERREECVNRRHGDVCECHYDLPTALGEIDRLKAENEKLTAELAAKEIRWTDAKPTTPGWWWRRVGKGHESSCAFVGTGWEPGELLAQLHRHSGLWKIENLEGQWSDKPIPQPEERT